MSVVVFIPFSLVVSVGRRFVGMSVVAHTPFSLVVLVGKRFVGMSVVAYTPISLVVSLRDFQLSLCCVVSFQDG